MIYNLIEGSERTDLLKELRRHSKHYLLKNNVTSVYRDKKLLTNEVELFINEISISDLIAIKIEQIMSLTKGKIHPILLTDIFKLVKLGYVKYSEKNNIKGISQHIINSSYKLKRKERNREKRKLKNKKNDESIGEI